MEIKDMELWQIVFMAIVGMVVTLTGFVLSIDANNHIAWVGIGICCIGLVVCIITVYVCTVDSIN